MVDVPVRSDLLHRAAALATDYLASLDERPVGRPVDLAALREAMGGPLPEGPSDPETVIEDLAAAVDQGLVASAGPRYFGFVVGGSLPAAVAADWLTSAWDQNAGLYVLSPAAAVAEEVAAAWLVELLGLPAGTSVGFVTGATMANFTALAAARHGVLAKTGWDVERHGLQGAPAVTVVTHEGTHVTVYASLQMLGLGREGEHVRVVASDDQGRMRPDALREVLAAIDGPTIVCAQAGNVNTGAFDPLDELVPIAHERGAWIHVDGAFGIWAAAVPSMRDRMSGYEAADSWSTDAHKWLNVPYDSGLVFVRDAAAHHAAMTLGAAYYIETGGERTGQLQLGPGVVAAGARVRRPGGASLARPVGSRGAHRARQRPCPADGGAVVERPAGHDPQRRRAQPGPRAVRGTRRRRRWVRRRRPDPGGHRGRPA